MPRLTHLIKAEIKHVPGYQTRGCDGLFSDRTVPFLANQNSRVLFSFVVTNIITINSMLPQIDLKTYPSLIMILLTMGWILVCMVSKYM